MVPKRLLLISINGFLFHFSGKGQNGNNDDEVESTSLGPGDMPTDRY